MAIEVVKGPGRPKSQNPEKSAAARQKRYRDRCAKLGIVELRGIRVSETEREVIDALAKAKGFDSRVELVVSTLMEEAASLGILIVKNHVIKTGEGVRK